MHIQVDPAVDVQKIPTKQLRPVRKNGQNVARELQEIVTVGRPWWFEAPEIAHKCLILIFAPIRLLAVLLDIIVSLTFVSLFGVITLWWFGYIPDEVVANYISSFGDRVLSIIQESGVL